MVWQYVREVAFRPPYQNKRDVILTCYSLCYLAACALVASVANAIADSLSRSLPTGKDRPIILIDPILGILYTFYSSFGFRKDLPDLMIGAALVSIFLRIFTLGEKTCTVLRRVIYIAGTMYLIRALHVNLTILPNPLESCRFDTQSVLFVRILHVIDSEYVTCGDVFFSGHAIIFSILWLVWLTYTGTQSRLGSYGRIFAGLQAAFSYISLLLASYHYTIDITVSIMLTTLFWTVAHMAISSKDLKQASYLVRALDSLDNCAQHDDYYPIQCTQKNNSCEEGLDWRTSR